MRYKVFCTFFTSCLFFIFCYCERERKQTMPVYVWQIPWWYSSESCIKLCICHCVWYRSHINACMNYCHHRTGVLVASEDVISRNNMVLGIWMINAGFAFCMRLRGRVKHYITCRHGCYKVSVFIRNRSAHYDLYDWILLVKRLYPILTVVLLSEEGIGHIRSCFICLFEATRALVHPLRKELRPLLTTLVLTHFLSCDKTEKKCKTQCGGNRSHASSVRWTKTIY